MGYWDQSLLSNDDDFIQRVAACAAVEVTLPDFMSPLGWANENIWLVAAAPGFADAYSSAIAGNVPTPGRDPSVISDAQILAAVQALLVQP